MKDSATFGPGDLFGLAGFFVARADRGCRRVRPVGGMVRAARCRWQKGTGTRGSLPAVARGTLGSEPVPFWRDGDRGGTGAWVRPGGPIGRGGALRTHRLWVRLPPWSIWSFDLSCAVMPARPWRAWPWHPAPRTPVVGSILAGRMHGDVHIHRAAIPTPGCKPGVERKRGVVDARFDSSAAQFRRAGMGRRVVSIGERGVDGGRLRNGRAESVRLSPSGSGPRTLTYNNGPIL